MQSRTAKTVFVENQISPSLISLSPLNTGHLSILKHTRVRTHQLLPIHRSLGFGYYFFNFKKSNLLLFTLCLLN